MRPWWRRFPQEWSEIRRRDLGVEEGMRVVIGVRSFPEMHFWMYCRVPPFLSLVVVGAVPSSAGGSSSVVTRDVDSSFCCLFRPFRSRFLARLSKRVSISFAPSMFAGRDSIPTTLCPYFFASVRLRYACPEPKSRICVIAPPPVGLLRALTSETKSSTNAEKFSTFFGRQDYI